MTASTGLPIVLLYSHGSTIDTAIARKTSSRKTPAELDHARTKSKVPPSQGRLTWYVRRNSSTRPHMSADRKLQGRDGLEFYNLKLCEGSRAEDGSEEEEGPTGSQHQVFSCIRYLHFPHPCGRGRTKVTAICCVITAFPGGPRVHFRVKYRYEVYTSGVLQLTISCMQGPRARKECDNAAYQCPLLVVYGPHLHDCHAVARNWRGWEKQKNKGQS